MPDSLMVCFSLAALVGCHATTRPRAATRALDRRQRRARVDDPGQAAGDPRAGADRGRPVARQGLAGAARPETLARARRARGAWPPAWYWHAYQIYLETGLTFGVIGTTKTYPAFVATSEWTTAFSKWSSVELLTSAPLYDLMLSRLYFLHLTPPGFALAMVGFVLWRAQPWRLVVDAWLAAMVALHPRRRARATWATTTTSCRWCPSARCTLPLRPGRCSMPAGSRRRSDLELAPRVGVAAVVGGRRGAGLLAQRASSPATSVPPRRTCAC